MVYPLSKDKVAETSGMIAIMAQWGLTSAELLPTIDKINKVADDFAITSTDLVSGLTRSSGAAKVLGLTMNETIAILTTMREATGRTGKEVGNALNSILSFMQRPTAIKAFETEGIRVFADEARTQFRNVIEIFDEMASKWPSMSEASMNAFADQAEAAGLYSEEMSEVMGMEEQYNDIQQRNLSQAAAGIYRRNYLLALLQNWSKVDEVLISQENSLGYSMKENERTMQTLAKQVEVLKASAEQLAVALGDAGLLNEIKGLVEGVTGAVQGFNNLDDDFQMFILTVLEVTVAVKLLDAALKMAGVSALLSGTTKVAGLAALGTSFSGAAKGLAGVGAAAAGAKAAVGTLARGLGSALGGPVGMAAIAIGTAIGFIARQSNRASEELESQATMAENLVGEYDSLTTKLGGMTKGTDEYNEAAKELNVLKGNIAESLPGVIDGWDKETGSMIINRGAMQDLIDAGDELKKSKTDYADATEEENAELEEERKAHEAAAQEYESSQGVLSDLTKRREGLTEVLAKQSAGSEEAKTTQEALGETEKLIADIAQEAGLKRNATVDDIMAKLKELSAAEKQASIDTQITEAEKTQSTINNTIRRLDAINQEIKAKQSLLPGGSGNDNVPAWLKGKYNYLPGGEGWIRKGLSNAQQEASQANAELAKTNAEYEKQLKAIGTSQDAINAMKADAIISNAGGGGGDPGSSGGSGSAAQDAYADWFEGYVDSIEENLLTANDAIYDHTNALDLLATKEAILKGQIGDGIPTFEQQMQIYGGLTDAVKQHNLIQDDLHTTADQYRVQMENISVLISQEDAKLKAGTITKQQHRESVDILRDKYIELSKAVDGMGISWWKEEQSEIESRDAIKEQANLMFDEAYKNATNKMQHEVSMARMSAEDQIDYLEDLRDAHEWTMDKMWDIEEKLYDLRKKAADSYLDEFEEAYNKELDALDKRTQKTVDRLQAQIDALDAESKSDDREKALDDHNKKLAELEKQRIYESLRTGQEHTDKLAEINQQVEEENQSWQEEQDKWAIEDKKEKLEEQIQEVKDAAKEEQNELKRHYGKAKSIAESGMDKIVYAIGEKELDFETTGKSLIDALIDGMMSGDFSGVNGLIESLTSGVDYSSINYDNTEVRNANESSGKANAHQDAEDARDVLNRSGYSQGASDISSYDYSGAKDWYDTYIDNGRTDLSSTVKNAFKDIVDAKKLYGGLAGGGIVPGGNPVLKVLGDASYDEAVIPFPKIQPMINDALEQAMASRKVLYPDSGGVNTVLSQMSKMQSQTSLSMSDNLDKAADRIVTAIGQQRVLAIDKLLNIENAGLDRNGMTDAVETLRKELSEIIVATG